MTPAEFSRLVTAWGGDEEAARRLHIKPRTVRALRTGHRRITPRVAAFINLLKPYGDDLHPAGILVLAATEATGAGEGGNATDGGNQQPTERTPMTIRFKNWTCELQKARYGNGRTALMLVDTEDSEPVATATVNLPDVPLAEDEVLVKDYAENEGMAKALEQAGIVRPTGRVVVSGYVQVPVCKLVG